MRPLTELALIDTCPLSCEQTVPRSWVHKHSLENVLLTEIRACGDDRFICAGRVPTAHRFFNEAGRTPSKDILFYTELGRQASLAISHAFLDVSTEDVFIFEGSKAVVTDAAWGDPCFDWVAIDVRILETTRRKNNAVSRVVADHIMSIAGQEVFRGTGAWTIQSAALFQRLRRSSASRSAPAPIDGPPSNVVQIRRHFRRERGDNVVISTPEYVNDSAEFVASLIVDDTHSYFFDHRCDHVPGMLLLEGCAQLALAAFAETASAPQTSGVRGYDMNFAQFVECHLPTTLTARVSPAQMNNGSVVSATVQISIAQQNVVCGTTTMSVAFPI
jgi:A-factor biosynthesis hotdog domain